MSRRKIICSIEDIKGVVEMLDSTGLTYHEIADQVKASGGKISPGTVANWFNEKVQSPQMMKIVAVAKAFNYEVQIVRASNAR